MDTIRIICHNRGIPMEFGEEFHRDMTAQGWQVKSTLKSGEIVPSTVTQINVGMILGTWWNNRKRRQKRQEKSTVLHQEQALPKFKTIDDVGDQEGAQE